MSCGEIMTSLIDVEHTARLLNDLGRLEMLKGFTLPNADTLSPKQEGILKFLHRIPEINPGVGLLMATQFRSLREILCRWVAFYSNEAISNNMEMSFKALLNSFFCFPFPFPC